MLRRVSRRCQAYKPPPNNSKPAGSGGMQRPGANVWLLRNEMTPKDIWTHLQTTYLNHKILGFTARCVLLALVVGGTSFGCYRFVGLMQENRPIAKQWVPRFREITFIERIEEKGSNMSIYRFALPNSYDYLGHDSVSSVELLFANHPIWPCRRWLTPISHPEQRGIVEFAMKFHKPGEFSLNMWSLQPGDKVTMGPWIKEWRYRPNEYKEVGMIMANSGITPALQLLVRALDDPKDTTKFSLLYCNASPEATPFYSKLRAIQAKYPDRFRLTFTVSAGRRGEVVVADHATKSLKEHGYPTESYTKRGLMGAVLNYDMGMGGDIEPVTLFKSVEPDYEGYIGNISRDIILEAMPPPGEPGTKILCCGPNGFMVALCGRTQGVFRTTYLEGFYHGILKDMGYTRGQVYKFGTCISMWLKFT